MTAGNVTVWGPDDRPIPARAIDQARQGGMRAQTRGEGRWVPYDAASHTSTELGDFASPVRSPDAEINPWRDRIVGRLRDVVRNDGTASGVLDRILDSTIGVHYRRICRPDWRRLSLFDSAFDAAWADEFARVAEALWRGYAEDDEGRWCDVSRQQTMAQQFRLGLRHKLADGDAVTLRYWLPERVGYGGADYATAFRVMDPDLLCNPMEAPDDQFLRGGVEIDGDGVAHAFHFRLAHPSDVYAGADAMTWERVEREDADGYRRVIHDFDRTRAGQNRGVSVFAPILARLAMLARYYGVELQAATVASVFGTFITSPFDHNLLEEALTAPEGMSGLSAYQDLRSAYHDKHKLTLNDVRIPKLAPGESIQTVAAARPSAAFSPFTHEMQRAVATCLGVSEQQVNADYSSINYSSLRGAIVEAEKTYTRRKGDFDANTANPVFACWMQEAMERGDFRSVLPRRAPDFRTARGAYNRGRWLGPPKGWVDPVAERQGVVLGMSAGLSTMDEECAAQGGDWEENLEQQAREYRRREELGLPHPQWQNENKTATEASNPPQKPTA